MKQHFTSAGTSINRNKLPAIYRRLEKQGLLAGKTILDYGCGKYTAHIEDFCASIGADWHGYDPYNQPKVVNMEANYYCSAVKKPEIAICSNVLNVIDSDETICRVLNLLPQVAERVFITVYEGDRTGNGRQTGPDQYQRNQPLKWYATFASDLGFKNKSLQWDFGGHTLIP